MSFNQGPELSTALTGMLNNMPINYQQRNASSYRTLVDEVDPSHRQNNQRVSHRVVDHNSDANTYESEFLVALNEATRSIVRTVTNKTIIDVIKDRIDIIDLDEPDDVESAALKDADREADLEARLEAKHAPKPAPKPEAQSARKAEARAREAKKQEAKAKAEAKANDDKSKSKQDDKLDAEDEHEEALMIYGDMHMNQTASSVVTDLYMFAHPNIGRLDIVSDNLLNAGLNTMGRMGKSAGDRAAVNIERTIKRAMKHVQRTHKK